MIRSLIRHDPHLRLLVVTSLAAAANAAFLAWLPSMLDSTLRTPEVRAAFPPVLFAVIASVVAMATILRPESAARRFDDFWLTLPASAQQFTRARLCAMLIASLLPALLGGVILLLGVASDQRGGVVTMVLWVTGSIGLAIVTHNLLSRGANFIGVRQWLPALAVLGLGLGLVGTKEASTPWYGAGLIAAATILGVVVWFTAPDWIPGSPAGVRDRSAKRGMTGVSLPRAAVAQWTLRDPAWMGLNVAGGVMIALVFSGATIGVIAFLPFIPFFLYTLNTRSSQVLHTIGHLPIDRGRVAAAIALPTLAIGLVFILVFDATIGDAIGAMGNRGVSLNAKASVIEGKKEYSTSPDVPDDLWRPHFGFEAPIVESPGGERHELEAHRPIPFLPIAVYNPYDIPTHASVGFASWQLSDCLTRVYGVDITPAEVAADHLEIGYNGLIHERTPPEGKQSLRNRFSLVEPIDRPTSQLSRLALFLALWFVVGRYSFRIRQYPRPRPGWRHIPVSWWVAGTVFAALFVSSVVSMSTQKLLGALLRAPATALVNAPWIGFSVLAILAALMSLRLMSLFRRMELPPRPPAAPIDKFRRSTA